MGDSREKAAEAKAKGNAAFSAKRYEEAVEHFSEAIKHDPSDHVFFSNRSACYASLEKYDKALEDGSECVKLKPDWAKGYARKGLAEFFLEKWDDASETYQAGLKLAPEDQGLKEGLKKAMDAKYDVAGARPIKRQRVGGRDGDMGRFDDAMLGRAAALSPKIKEYLSDPAFKKKLQVLQGIMKNGPDPASEALLSSLVRDDPRVIEVMMAMQGISVDVCGGRETQKAEATTQSTAPSAGTPSSNTTSGVEPIPTTATPAHKAPTLSKTSEKKEEAPPPEDLRTPEQREADELKAQGNTFYKKRKFDEAIGLYDKAIEKQPNDMTYYFNKCAAWIEMGADYHDKVLQTCQDLLSRRYEINSANPGGASFEKVAKVYSRMASVYEKQKKYDEAIEMYNKSLTEENSRHTRNALRDVERAKEKYEKERYLDSSKAEEHREKGNECFKAKDWVGAKQEYDEALRRNPSDAKLYSNRAAALTKLFAYPDALRDLDECLKLDPTFIKAYSRKGAAHFFMKEYHKALEAYEKGLEKDPKNEECQQGRQQVLAKVRETNKSDDVDEEQVRHAMADPEIQKILKDPQVNMFLKQMQENPVEATKALQKDAQLSNAVNKLMAAGIVRAR